MFFLPFYSRSGGCCGSTKKRTIVGGWAWAWWLVTDVQRLSLEVMTLNPMCEMVETAQGVPLTVTGVAQCKIMKVFILDANTVRTSNRVGCSVRSNLSYLNHVLFILFSNNFVVVRKTIRNSTMAILLLIFILLVSSGW